MGGECAPLAPDHRARYNHDGPTVGRCAKDPGGCKVLVGADPEELEKLAELFRSGAKQMTRSASNVTTAMSRARWEGPDAAEFRRRWTSTHRPLLYRVADEMDSFNRRLREEARHQREASDGGGGAVGGGVGGGGGGSWSDGSSGSGGDGAGDRIGSGGGDSGSPIHGGVNVTGTKFTGSYLQVSGTKGWEKGQDGKFHPIDKDPKAHDPNEAKVKVSADVSTEVASDHREAILGAHGVKSGEYHGAVDASGSVEATAGIKATNDAGIKVGADGVTASANGSVIAGVEVGAQGEVGKGPVKVSGSANAMAGAEASYNASAQVGPGGVEVKGGLDAFAGGRASVDAGFDLAGVKVGGGAGVEYGIGAGVEGSASFNTHKIGFSGDAHVAFGLGLELKLDLSVDPTEVAENVVDAGSFVWKHMPNIELRWW